MNANRLLPAFLTLALFATITDTSAQSFTRASYRLLDGSTLLDDCPICGRPTIVYTLRGTFDLVLQEQNILFSTYLVTNIQFRAIGGFNGYTITGSGRYQIGGEVAIQQHLVLDLSLDSKPVTFTNDSPATEKLFPLISVQATQTTPSFVQVFSLNLIAAPVREIWFSTVSGFTSAGGATRGTGGDLLSAEGRIVKSGADIVSAFNLPPGSEIRLDAVDVQPGGEIFFSLATDQPVSKLGVLHHGDLLSNRGRIVKRNQELTAAFGIMPLSADVGLDALNVASDGTFLFSITTDAFSEKLGRLLRRGDVLSSSGVVVAGNGQLLSRFHPDTSVDRGLDALFVWPSGEIWFSTEVGFQDGQLGAIGTGDILSDQGVIVYHNLELMSAFAPVEDLADFGLDALFVVTDVSVSAGSGRPRLTGIRHSDGNTHLEWNGPGRVFQVIRSGLVDGVYDPVSPLLLDLSFDDRGASGKAGFYQVRQW